MNDLDPHDREFEDFLKRRRPLFRRTGEDALEPPAELDRIVLRQAREAIESDPPQRMYRAPRWTAPLAIAATLVLGLTFVFKAGMSTTEVRPQVTIENVAQRLDVPAAEYSARPPSPAPESARKQAEAPVIVELAKPAAPTAPLNAAAEPMSPPPPGRAAPNAESDVAFASTAESPAWRRDSRAWLAEIERLRASGDVTRADAELAEYNRQHRALAVSPDR